MDFFQARKDRPSVRAFAQSLTSPAITSGAPSGRDHGSFIDAATAQRFEEIFERYAADGSEIELERWSRRSPFHKLVDHEYYLFNEFL